jgi:hypothetical protein
MKTFSSLTLICCNSILENKIYYHNIVTRFLESILDDLKRKIFPEEFYDYEDEPYWDGDKVYVPDNCKFNFSYFSNAKIIKQEIFLIFKKQENERYVKDKIIYDKKLLKNFKNKTEFLVVNKNEYIHFANNYLLIDDYDVLI